LFNFLFDFLLDFKFFNGTLIVLFGGTFFIFTNINFLLLVLFLLTGRFDTGRDMTGSLGPLGYGHELLWFEVSMGEEVGLEVGSLIEAFLTDGAAHSSVRWCLLHVE